MNALIYPGNSLDYACSQSESDRLLLRSGEGSGVKVQDVNSTTTLL